MTFSQLMGSIQMEIYFFLFMASNSFLQLLQLHIFLTHLLNFYRHKTISLLSNFKWNFSKKCLVLLRNPSRKNCAPYAKITQSDNSLTTWNHISIWYWSIEKAAPRQIFAHILTKGYIARYLPINLSFVGFFKTFLIAHKFFSLSLIPCEICSASLL